MPALLKIGLSFAAILALNRLRLPLSLAILAAGALLGVWAGMAPADLAAAMLRSAFQRETVYLLLVVLMILFLSRLLEEAGRLQRMVAAFRGIVRDRRALSALLPALIGFLPMPGGALFSAPMLETAVAGSALADEEKAVINYWFRHIWEYWWPLYPGFVLAVGLLEVPTGLFIAVQFPLTIFSALAGVVFLLRGKTFGESGGGGESGRREWGEFFSETMPLGVLCLVILGLSLLHRALPPGALPSELTMLGGLLSCILAVVLRDRISFSAAAGVLRDRRFVSFAGLVIAIMALKAVLREGALVLSVKEELAAAGIPPLLIIAALPFLAGMITGIAFGFVGVSFPIVIPLLPAGDASALLIGGSFAFFCGYLGMILSPVHVCFVFSKDYFRAGFPRCFRLLLPPAGLLVLLAGVYYAILFLAAQ